MKILFDAARRVHCDMFLYAGTALGAMVHGGPIPWDDVVDVLVPFDCRDKLQKAVK